MREVLDRGWGEMDPSLYDIPASATPSTVAASVADASRSAMSSSVGDGISPKYSLLSVTGPSGCQLVRREYCKSSGHCTQGVEGFDGYCAAGVGMLA